MSGGLSTPGGFFADADFDFDARLALGARRPVGFGDAGLVLATLDRIVDGDRQSWFDAWTGVASDLAARGDQALGGGISPPPAGLLLCGGRVLRQSAGLHRRAGRPVGAVADLPRAPQLAGRRWSTPRRVASCGWTCRMRRPGCRATCSAPTHRGGPADVRDDQRERRARCPACSSYGAAEALARGWNAFLFDGPGQQSMLFERGVPFRHDWEAVLTPVIDALVERPDVDPSALTGYGVSQGGYWITRAVAFEHRLVAAVADPGVVDISAGWTQHLPHPLRDTAPSRAKRTPSTPPGPGPGQRRRPRPGPSPSGASPTA